MYTILQHESDRAAAVDSWQRNPKIALLVTPRHYSFRDGQTCSAFHKFNDVHVAIAHKTCMLHTYTHDRGTMISIIFFFFIRNLCSLSFRQTLKKIGIFLILLRTHLLGIHCILHYNLIMTVNIYTVHKLQVKRWAIWDQNLFKKNNFIVNIIFYTTIFFFRYW